MTHLIALKEEFLSLFEFPQNPPRLRQKDPVVTDTAQAHQHTLVYR